MSNKEKDYLWFRGVEAMLLDILRTPDLSPEREAYFTADLLEVKEIIKGFEWSNYPEGKL